MLLGILLLFLGLSCVTMASYQIGQTSMENNTPEAQQKYNTSVVVAAIAFAVVLSGTLVIATQWNPLGSLGEFTVSQPSQGKSLGDLL